MLLILCFFFNSKKDAHEISSPWLLVIHRWIHSCILGKELYRYRWQDMDFYATQVYKKNYFKIITMHREWHLVNYLWHRVYVSPSGITRTFWQIRLPLLQCFLCTYRLMTIPTWIQTQIVTLQLCFPSKFLLISWKANPGSLISLS